VKLNTQTISFKYDGYLDELLIRRFLFRAHQVGTNKRLIVKFGHRPYPWQLHQKLHKEGFAPELLCGTFFAPWWYVVVMEDLGEDAKHLTKGAITTEIKEKVVAGVKIIHDAGFVHGDLRGPNILVKGAKIYILDLEWAGKAGDAYYPFDLNTEVFGKDHEAQGIKRGAVITQKHDEWMLNLLWK